jgi:hypothetical protein
MMSTVLVLSRALHFGATLLLFGGFVIWLAVVCPATRAPDRVASDIGERVGRFLRIAAWWALSVALFSGAVWLIVGSALISGRPIAEMTSGDTLGRVVTGTLFGHVWIARFVPIVALCALLVTRMALPPGRRSHAVTWLALGVAFGLLASLALVGHLAAARGVERYVRIAVDIVHLVAAGLRVVVVATGVEVPKAEVPMAGARSSSVPTSRRRTRCSPARGPTGARDSRRITSNGSSITAAICGGAG